MVVAVKFSGVEVGFARKLAPTDQPVELLLTRTRCSWSKSIEIGDPDVPAWTAEAVNRWLLVLHVPPTAWYVHHRLAMCRRRWEYNCCPRGIGPGEKANSAAVYDRADSPADDK